MNKIIWTTIVFLISVSISSQRKFSEVFDDFHEDQDYLKIDPDESNVQNLFDDENPPNINIEFEEIEIEDNSLNDEELNLLHPRIAISVLYTQPEQIHLAIGNNITTFVVTWQTMSLTPTPTCKYGRDGTVKIATGDTTLFVDGGKEKLKRYIHRVQLENLIPRQKYVYHCGSTLGWSNEFWFWSLDPSQDWAPTLAVYGDLGNINAKALPFLQEETESNYYDAVLHVGDFAYDMCDAEGEVGDEFMRQIEPIAAYVPYMVSPGNHEEAYNFSHYRYRFSMPNVKEFENLYYEFKLGPVQFISFNTEAYYFLKYGMNLVVNQYKWLEKVLEEANKPENRARWPWIITYGHRPMYCSDDDGDDCLNWSSLIRSGLRPSGSYGLEDLFYKAGVDLEIWAHEHSYERLWPIYNHTVYNGSNAEPYTNPNAPVHVISGSAGCQEFTDHFIKQPKPWSAFRNSDYGYARLKIFNHTHLYWEQVSAEKEGDVIDSMWLIKDHHGPYTKK
ncbi:acid phosphatase type 7 isoform X2 [Halyomorpha halys]|nr:acid phosphatase type 7 [Halyomorpha halys]